jgi:hypothetical protein
LPRGSARRTFELGPFRRPNRGAAHQWRARVLFSHEVSIGMMVHGTLLLDALHRTIRESSR